MIDNFYVAIDLIDHQPLLTVHCRWAGGMELFLSIINKLNFSIQVKCLNNSVKRMRKYGYHLQTVLQSLSEIVIV